MNLVWGALIIAVVTAAAIAVMLFVRRRAPDGSYFEDGDRASGVFGVLAAGFSILLGFIIFLAFSQLRPVAGGRRDRSGHDRAAGRDAQLFPEDRAAELTGELVCYGRSVIGEEWDRMRSGTIGDHVNPWGIEMFTLDTNLRAGDRERAVRITTSGSSKPRHVRRRASIAYTVRSG